MYATRTDARQRRVPRRCCWMGPKQGGPATEPRRGGGPQLTRVYNQRARSKQHTTSEANHHTQKRRPTQRRGGSAGRRLARPGHAGEGSGPAPQGAAVTGREHAPTTGTGGATGRGTGGTSGRSADKRLRRHGRGNGRRRRRAPEQGKGTRHERLLLLSYAGIIPRRKRGGNPPNYARNATPPCARRIAWGVATLLSLWYNPV